MDFATATGRLSLPIIAAQNSRVFEMCLKQVSGMHTHSSRVEDNTRNTNESSITRAIVLAIVFASSATACVSTQNHAAQRIFEAWSRGASYPNATRIDETLTIQTAYAVQKAFVRQRIVNDSITGFKGGLTSPASQVRFHTDAPIAGVLIGAPLRDGATVRLSELRGLNIETEVAFRIGKPIERPLGSVAALKKHVDGIAPAIELPNLDYESMTNLDVRDIVDRTLAAV